MQGRDDVLLKIAPMLQLVNNWHNFLANGISAEEYDVFQRHERTGRPLGSKGFVAGLENALSRILNPQKGGKPKKC